MTTLSNRPFIGNWVANMSLVRHAPDAIVLINGYEEFATCSSCSKKLNISKYITQISVDATTDPISNANFSASIPQSELSQFQKDGNYLLQPNLEVVILMKGYFPTKGFADLGQPDEEGFDAGEVPVYPYYQVFRGVVTNVSHDFSGGFYSAQVQCANLLHFWQNLKLSVNGAVMGKRPKGSMVEPSLVGHKFTSMNPYAIIYTLVKVTFGAAYGVDFQLSKSSNITANDDDDTTSLYAHAAEWWAKRWTEHSGSLRMYGVDGQIYNNYQQAYLGAWYDTRSKARVANFSKTTKRIYTALTKRNDWDYNRSSQVLKALRENAYDPISTTAGVYSDEDGRKITTEDVLRMQAFNLDIGKMGQVNMFETEYMSKLEIAEAVKTITGYEFYQDVDGDLVFKPPMYNLDTRDDPVYRISDRDLISISPSEGEPEATMVKGTGSHFANLSGHGIEGWLGVGAVFIDYRLVAKYGYREETFEANFFNSRQAIYISAINRLDLANSGVNSATITIPLRPEMRPGYPVYVEHMDCFYYAKSISHSVSFGGQCTTTITGMAKRSKWFPPIKPNPDNEFPSIDDVKLDAPGEYPQRPLIGYPQNLNAGSSAVSSGPPRMVGFPDVVMALDPDRVNFDTVDVDLGTLTADAFIEIALNSGFLERGEDDNTFYLRASNESRQKVTLSQVRAEYSSVSEALKAGTFEPDPTTAIGKILAAVEGVYGEIDSSETKQLVNYLALQGSLKANFAPGVGISGRYRYFSSAHKDADMQGPKNLNVDLVAGSVGSETPSDTPVREVLTLDNAGDGKGIRVFSRPLKRGVKISKRSQKASSDESEECVTVATGDIRFVTFGPQYQRKNIALATLDEGWTKGTNFPFNRGGLSEALVALLEQRIDPDPTLTMEQRFTTEYDRLVEAIDAFSTGVSVSGLTQRSEAVDFIGTLTNLYTSYARKDKTAIGRLAKKLAEYLTRWIVAITGEVAGRDDFELNAATYMQARADFIEDFTDGAVEMPDASAGTTFFNQINDKRKVSWTPIFPVSDGGGYEVFGNLPYGRGLSIQKYAGLVGATKEGPAGAGSTVSSEESRSIIPGYEGVNAADLELIETFYLAYQINQSIGGDAAPSAILQNRDLFSEADQAAILASENTTLDLIDGLVETLTDTDASVATKVRNTPVTSFFRGQAVSETVAARNLATLPVDGEVCNCQGTEGAFLLEAYSEEFVDVYGPEPVQGVMEQDARFKTESWKFTKEALSGQNLDTRNTNLAQQFTQQGDIAQSLGLSGEDD